ncbi:PNPOx family protein [Altererythrobacter lutimaris]|uniref:Flavin-binding protein n=1 Tax=Altererythrobacter lutimaris TaxID=2743979 RepID=A0A850HC24_9SPHN|nr:flavin-binding protein [Altererythrobacter lutimaris]NVE94476.1 flavin-binding protein [Altererythrobacter lutimaris]
MFDTLDDVRADIARRLTRAAKDRKNPMHTPVIATADADARVMVLRDFDSDTWSLRFHTDSRAPKCKAIGESGSPIAVLGYDKPQKVQLRLRGEGRIVREGEEVDTAWAASTNFARRCYLGEGPGSASDAPTSGLPGEYEGVEPSDEVLTPARENFAILKIELRELDWFYLAHTGHVRAQFSRAGKGEEWQGRWVSP